MSCEKVQKLISALVDRQLAASERAGVLEHMDSCRECSARAESIASLRSALGRMREVPPPAYLRTRLRVIASHERARRMSRVSLSARIAQWKDQARLAFDNLMRPLALPFAGGSLMALVTFSLLVPSLTFSHNFNDPSWFRPPVPESDYVPGVVHGALVVRADIAAPEGVNAVELTIDEQGKVRNYSLVSGSLTPDLQSIIMLPPPFRPAIVSTPSGTNMPIPSKVKVIECRIPGDNRS
jgi:anti-sigma factor RsiW